MKPGSFALISLLIIVIITGLVFGYMKKVRSKLTSNNMTNFFINSPAFSEGEMIPPKYTCDGSNTRPELNFSGIPAEAKSLAIIVDDPDAPRGNFNHWVAWNIDPKISKLDEGTFPEGGVQGTNDAGKDSFIGPCPPSGTHRYYFKAYALDMILDIPSSAKKNHLWKAMEGHVIAEGQLMGKYERK